MTIAQALAFAATLGIDRLDAQLLMLHVLGREETGRGWLLAHDADAVPQDALARFAAQVRDRADGKPLAYLTGRRGFYGLDLRVDPRVLVPRPDTETLVEWTLELLGERPHARVVDLGTGSGAIALAIKHSRPGWEVAAVDASPGALEVASANGKRLGLAVAWRQGSWLEGVEGPLDAIVSNPPYIAAGDPHLPALAHEPAMALESGPDGLDDLRRIIGEAPSRLAAGGWLLLEHGWDQAAAVRGLLREAGLVEVSSRKDLAGIERCSGGQRPGMK
ncbi:MAG: peptide chain release factor N(5)-glutamine methyltransferase [Burkholderiaceae bacterium]